MEINDKEIGAPKPQDEKTSENQGEKPTGEEPEAATEEVLALKKQIDTLQAQKEHWREKFEKQKEATPPSEEIPADEFSDEGKVLADEIKKLNGKLMEINSERELDKIFNQYPQLGDKKTEFNEFREQYPNISAEKVAKLFLSESGLLSSNPERKGLEKPTSGAKPTQPAGISGDDVKRLRETDEKKWLSMITSGKLKSSDIKE